MTIEVALSPNDSVKVVLRDTDGEFTITYGDKALTVESDLPDTQGRQGVIYEEKFGTHLSDEPRAKQSPQDGGAPSTGYVGSHLEGTPLYRMPRALELVPVKRTKPAYQDGADFYRGSVKAMGGTELIAPGQLLARYEHPFMSVKTQNPWKDAAACEQAKQMFLRDNLDYYLMDTLPWKEEATV